MVRHFCILATLISALSVHSQVILEDFNDFITSQTTFGNRLGLQASSGYWYGYNENVPNASTIDPEVIDTDTTFSTAIIPEGPDSSNCLHVSFKMSKTITNPYVAIGFQINTTDIPWMDLSSMTSFTFMAKGKGTVRVKLLTDKVTNGYPPGSNWGDMGADVTLTSDWKKHTINSQQIAPQKYSPQETDKLTWAECAKKVNKIHFQSGPSSMAGDSLSIYLDDMVMNGVTEENLGIPAVNIGHGKLNYIGNNGFKLRSHHGFIAYNSSIKEKVTIDLYTISGGFLKQLLNANVSQAKIPITFPAGNYLCKISSHGKSVMTPVLILK